MDLCLARQSTMAVVSVAVWAEVLLWIAVVLVWAEML